MQILGDLERAFATTLYPLRLPLAILTVGLAIGLLWLAWRRGWLAAARRHPARSGVLLVVVLAIALPAAWYLAGPLFIRTELQEEAPVAIAGTAPSSPSPAAGGEGAEPALTPGSSPAPSAAPSAGRSAPASEPAPTSRPVEPSPTSTPSPPLLRAGTFSGADDFHFGRGQAILAETEPGRYVVRFEDFSVRNGPDLFVYLSPDPDSYADGAIEVGRLRATDGSFNTPVPDGVDVSSAQSVVIWCKEFAVLFAVAPLDG